jgi:hypothetical protein
MVTEFGSDCDTFSTTTCGDYGYLRDLARYVSNEGPAAALPHAPPGGRLAVVVLERQQRRHWGHCCLVPCCLVHHKVVQDN